MSILDRIEIIHGDVRDIPCDLMILKYADGLYGADFAVADRLRIDFHVSKGQTRYFEGAVRPVPGRQIGAAWVMYHGVGDLFAFRYDEIRQFAYATLVHAGEVLDANGTVATTIHGPGYGLDEREALLAQLGGYLDLADHASQAVGKLLIVEQDDDRAKRLARILADYRQTSLEEFAELLKETFSVTARKKSDETGPPPRIRHVEKPKLFAAMPFADKYLDEYHIGFVEAAHAHDFLCERLDLEHYVGDVIDEIFKRIRASAGVVALLNENNPNVFLEVGYAMALDKPVILVAREDLEVAFDLRSQRRQTYSSIYKLREDLTELIGELKAKGTLD